MSATKSVPANVIVLRLQGTISQNDLLQMKQQLLEKFETHERVSIVMDATDWEDITGDAILEDLKTGMEFFQELDRIDRVAIISDKQWYKAVAGFMNPFTSMEIKVFDSKDTQAMEEAVKFTSESSAVSRDKSNQPSIIQLETDSPNLLAFEYHGRLGTEDLDVVLEPFNKALATGKPIDLFVRLRELKGFDPELLMQKSLISLKMSALKNVRRYAIVGANHWMTKLIETFQPMVAIEIRTFKTSQEQQAWDWLES